MPTEVATEDARATPKLSASWKRFLLALGATTLLAAGWSFLNFPRYWTEIFKRTLDFWEQLSGQTLLSIICVAASGFIVKVFLFGGDSVRFSWRGLLGWLKSKALGWFAWIKTSVVVVCFWVAVLLIYSVFCLQPRMYSEMKVRADAVQNQSPSAQLGEERADLTKRIDQSLSEHKRVFVDTLTSNRPTEATLAAIVSKAVDRPEIANTDRHIDLNSVDAVVATIDETKTQQAAKALLERVESEPLDRATFLAALPHIEYHMSEFIGTLRNLGEQNGDKLISNYTNAAQTFALPYGQYSTIELAKNSEWIFRVYVRKDPGLAPGVFKWMIVRPDHAPDFTCTFSGRRYAYTLSGAPAALGQSGQGEIEFLGHTNLVGALTWFIGFQKAAHPLKRVQ